jgi:hypothetical protein
MIASYRQLGSSEMISEKRKYPRFLAKDDAYALVGNHVIKVGRLKDISIAGLAFTYIENTESCVKDFYTGTIFVTDSEFYLSNLSCRMIYDSPLDETFNNRFFKTAFRAKRCGIQFTHITEYQLKKLKFLINHHTQ